MGRRQTREMQGGPLTLEKYHRFFVDPWGTRLTIDHLNHIIAMHGFVKLHRHNKGRIMDHVVGQVDLEPPRRSTLHGAAPAAPPSAAVITTAQASADLDTIGWAECPIGCVAAFADFGDAPEPVERTPRPADLVLALAVRRARSKRTRSSAYRRRGASKEVRVKQEEEEGGDVVASTVASAAVDALSVSATSASAAVDALPDSATSASVTPAAKCCGAAATGLGPPYAGAAASLGTTRLWLAHGEATASATTGLWLAHGDGTSSAAIMGIAVAHGATAVAPGRACGYAASSARTSTLLAPTNGAAVLSGTVLGRAPCDAATTTARALGPATSTAAAPGLHQVAASSGAAAATTSSYAAAAAAAAFAGTAAATATGGVLGQTGVLGSASSAYCSC